MRGWRDRTLSSFWDGCDPHKRKGRLCIAIGIGVLMSLIPAKEIVQFIFAYLERPQLAACPFLRNSAPIAVACGDSAAGTSS